MTDAHFNSLNSFQQVGRKLTLLEARVTFAAVHQRDSQYVEEFASELRAAAGDCKFGATLDTRLRDQFVFGLVPGVIHDLLSEEDYNITFSDAVKKASDLELELERFGSRSLLVPDWLAPQSKITSDPLAVDNPATRLQLSEPPLASHYSESMQSGPHPSCYDSGPQQSGSSSSSVAPAPTLHSEPPLQPMRDVVIAPTETTQSAPFEQIPGRTPDPNPAFLQLISEDHLANARTEISLSGLDSWTPDSAATELQVVSVEHLAEASTETFRSELDFTLRSPKPQVVQAGSLQGQRGSYCAMTSSSTRLKRWSRSSSTSALLWPFVRSKLSFVLWTAHHRSGRPDLINTGCELGLFALFSIRFNHPIRLKSVRLHCNHRKKRLMCG